MELIKKAIHSTQEGKSIYERFYLDEDCNVPEQKEDVRQIIFSEAKVKTEDIRQVENYIRVTGKAYYRILYMSEGMDAKPGIIEGKLPFEEMIYCDSNENETFFIRNIRTEITASVVHSRKLGIRIMAELEIGREWIRDEELTADVQSSSPIYKKMKKVNLLRLAVMKKDTYRIKESVTLPGTKESVGQLLVSDLESRKLDIRVGQDEIIIRGELQLFCMYLSAEEKTDWLEQTVPYEGRIPCSGAAEGMYSHIRHSLEDMIVDVRLDEDGEMRILELEATLILKMNLYSEEETEILCDMYSLKKKCVTETQDVMLEELLMQNQSKCKVTERLALPELKDDVLQILHSSGSIQPESEQFEKDGIRIEGVLHLTFLYLRGNDQEPYGSWQGIVPFSYFIDYAGMPEHVSSSISCHIEQLLVTLAGSEAVEVKAVLAFDIFLKDTQAVGMITDGSEEDMDMEAISEGPGIVGHIVQKGEDLWSLAKKYMTTVEGIKMVNGLETDTVRQGDKLLIFKENVSIL